MRPQLSLKKLGQNFACNVFQKSRPPARICPQAMPLPTSDKLSTCPCWTTSSQTSLKDFPLRRWIYFSCLLCCLLHKMSQTRQKLAQFVATLPRSRAQSLAWQRPALKGHFVVSTTCGLQSGAEKRNVARAFRRRLSRP
ncbi:unnamed protein product [Ixodes hexagonus]